ncbi:MAG: ribonuclease HII [Woeseiaceae bacterium]|nr:ribonuclease HII [Woeseiaceae bacterium]
MTLQETFIFGASWPLAGVDEAGRGPLAGPVVAAAVILDPDTAIDGLADSKCLSADTREGLACAIMARALAWSVSWSDPAEIDRLNILQATLLAMRRAILGLRIPPARVVVDGNRLPDLNFYGRQIDGCAVIGGDARVASISAASILAKVRRDRIMTDMDVLYPQYGFRRHKGYATADHRERLGRFGPCSVHRQSFSPVSALLSG